MATKTKQDFSIDYSKDFEFILDLANPMPMLQFMYIKSVTGENIKLIQEAMNSISKSIILDILFFVYVFKRLNIYQLSLLTGTSYSAVHKYINQLIDKDILDCKNITIDRKPSKVVSLKIRIFKRSEWIKDLLDNRDKLKKIYVKTKYIEDKKISTIKEKNKGYINK